MFTLAISCLTMSNFTLVHGTNIPGFYVILFFIASDFHYQTLLQLSVISALAKLCYEVLLHPPYSPDLSPADYHFFKHLNTILQGKHFHNQQKAENAFQEFFESHSKDFSASGISKLISHWQKCVDCHGSYFN